MEVIDELNEIREVFASSLYYEGAIGVADDLIKKFDAKLDDRYMLTHGKAIREVVGGSYTLSAACMILSDGRLNTIANDHLEMSKEWFDKDEPEEFYESILYALEWIAHFEIEGTSRLKDVIGILISLSVYVSAKTLSGRDKRQVTFFDMLNMRKEKDDIKISVRDFIHCGTFMDTNEYVFDESDTFNDYPREDDSVYGEGIADFQEMLTNNECTSGDELVMKIYKIILRHIKLAVKFVQDNVKKGYNHGIKEHRYKMLHMVETNLIKYVMMDLKIPIEQSVKYNKVIRPVLDVVMRDILSYSVTNLYIIDKLTMIESLKLISEIKRGIKNERILQRIHQDKN